MHWLDGMAESSLSEPGKGVPFDKACEQAAEKIANADICKSWSLNDPHHLLAVCSLAGNRYERFTSNTHFPSIRRWIFCGQR